MMMMKADVLRRGGAAAHVAGSQVALAASNYVLLAIAARHLDPAGFAAVSAYYLLINTVGRGLFAAVELETTRAVAAGAHGMRDALRHTGVLLVGALVLLGLAAPLLTGGAATVVLLAVGAVTMAASYLIRGPLAGKQRYGRYAATFWIEAAAGLVGAVVLTVVDERATAVWIAVLAVAPAIAPLLLWRRGDHSQGDTGGAPVRPVLWSAALLLASQGVWNLAPVLATARLADAATLAAGFTTVAVVVRAPVLLFPTIQAMLLPRLAGGARTPRPFGGRGGRRRARLDRAGHGGGAVRRRPDLRHHHAPAVVGRGGAGAVHRAGHGGADRPGPARGRTPPARRRAGLARRPGRAARGRPGRGPAGGGCDDRAARRRRDRPRRTRDRREETVTPTVGVVVLAWGEEPYLAECVAAVRASEGVDVRLVVVDNGSPDAPPDALRPGRNTGFAGGCNLGAAALDTEYLALVNSDCVVAPDTLAKLVAEAARPDVGPVMASIRLPDGLLNSAGNPVHLIGLSWAGGMGTPETRTAPYDVTGASGACLLLATTVWKQLGGFDEEYFAYLEDSELSLRAWRLGLAARCVPTAVARHHYEFSRNAHKMHLLERNRLMLLATVWPRRALILLAPVLAACELVLLALGTASAAGARSRATRGCGATARTCANAVV